MCWESLFKLECTSISNYGNKKKPAAMFS